MRAWLALIAEKVIVLAIIHHFYSQQKKRGNGVEACFLFLLFKGKIE